MQLPHPGFVIAAALISGLAVTPVRAASTVRVLLQDPSTGNGVTSMQIVPRPNHVKAGRVTFEVSNKSKELVHEMLLLRAPQAGDPLPYDAKDQRVVEAKTVKLVDTDNIKPGASVRKTVTLHPGAYEMICNQPGHYAQGMEAALTVTQ